MPPHCDTLDGPVVSAAKKALETGNVNLILPWVPEKTETELKKAFEKTLHTALLDAFPLRSIRTIRSGPRHGPTSRAGLTNDPM